MESFFKSALELVKSDMGIVAIVLIVAIMFAIISMKKRKKITDSFSGNRNTVVDVEAKNSEDGVSIENSGNNNTDSEINIKL